MVKVLRGMNPRTFSSMGCSGCSDPWVTAGPAGHRSGPERGQSRWTASAGIACPACAGLRHPPCLMERTGMVACPASLTGNEFPRRRSRRDARTAAGGPAEAVDAGPVGPVGIAVAEPAKPRADDTHDIGPTRAGGGLPPELDPRRPRRRRPRPKHAVRRIVLGVLLVALVIPGWSVGQALTASGTDSVAARLAEWARGHGGARVVTWAEQLQYRLHPPKTGGTPAGGIPGSTGTDPHLQASRPLHPVPAVVSPALPGEGQWRVLTAVRGHPAVQAAYLRPDATHTSYLAAVAELDPALVRVDLHPGTQEPGVERGNHAGLVRRQGRRQRPGTVAGFLRPGVQVDAHQRGVQLGDGGE